MAKNGWLGLFLAIAILIVSGCQRRPVELVVRADAPRDAQPVLSDSDLPDLVRGNSAFAFDLYQALRKSEDGNLFYSPYSISLALAMAYAGAGGETERQMAQVLHYMLAQGRLHAALNALDQELAQRGEGAKGKDGEGFRLNIVNAIWGQEGFQFLPGFLELLARNYGAGLRPVDFIKAAEASRKTINDWVAKQTEGKIKDLIPEGAIDSLTRLVLTNAVYFNAAWRYPFQEAQTRDGTFYLPDGTEVTVPMMSQSEAFAYAAGEGYQAIELPYDGGEMSMVILVPNAGQLGAFEDALSAEQVEAILKDLKPTEVALTMPKFEFESGLSLSDVLAAMGMPDAFDPHKADLSGMTKEQDLYISDVIHKAFVSVDESGTEAAAATAVIIRALSMPQESVHLTIDHPFIFLIRDLQTQSILFVGRVTNPAS